eukprot:4641612-Lingulodinium_polyedra.AAC.1
MGIWEEERRKKSEAAAYVPQMQQWRLTDHEAQFLNEMRRRLDCLWVGRNTDWAHNAGKHPRQSGDPVHYRCPRCGP